MNRVTIRRFDIVRTANIVAVLYAVIVVVIGLLFLVPVSLLAIVGTAEYGDGASAGMAGAGIVGVLVLLAIGVVFYGVLGWIMTAIVCALYNAVAGRIGGIRVDVQVEGPYPGGPGDGVPSAPAFGTPGYGSPGWGSPGTGTLTWPAPNAPGAQPPPPPGPR